MGATQGCEIERFRGWRGGVINTAFRRCKSLMKCSAVGASFRPFTLAGASASHDRPRSAAGTGETLWVLGHFVTLKANGDQDGMTFFEIRRPCASPIPELLLEPHAPICLPVGFTKSGSLHGSDLPGATL